MRCVALLTLAVAGCTEFQDGTLGVLRLPSDAAVVNEEGGRSVRDAQADRDASGGASERDAGESEGGSPGPLDASVTIAEAGTGDAGHDAGAPRDAGKDAAISEHCMREPWECP